MKLMKISSFLINEKSFIIVKDPVYLNNVVLANSNIPRSQ